MLQSKIKHFLDRQDNFQAFSLYMNEREKNGEASASTLATLGSAIIKHLGRVPSNRVMRIFLIGITDEYYKRRNPKKGGAST